MHGMRLQIAETKIRDFCIKHHVQKMEVFGSVLRDDFRPDSDLDILVTFAEGAKYSLFELERIQHELENIVGRRVDLVEKRSVEMSENYIRRNNILRSSVPIYVA